MNEVDRGLPKYYLRNNYRSRELYELMIVYKDVKNREKQIKGAPMSERKFRAILKVFCMDIPAHHTALLTSVSRRTVN